MLWWFVGVWLASGAVVPVLLLLRAAWRGIFPRDIEADQRQVAVEPHSTASAASTTRSAYGIRRLGSPLARWVFRLQGHAPGNARTTPQASHMGRYMLSGLVSIAALILLFVGSFSDSIIKVRDMPATSAVAQAPVAQAAVAEAGPLPRLASAVLAACPTQLPATSVQAAADGEHGVARRGLLPDPASPSEAQQVALIQPRTGDMEERAGDDSSHQTDAAASQVAASVALLTVPVAPKGPGAERGWGQRRPGGAPVRPDATRASRGTWLFAPNSNGGANS
jgi:hypothetical protein